MQRKIIQHSPTSLGMSLPAKWVSSHKLKKGDSIDLKDNMGVLEIRALSYKLPEKAISIDCKKYGKLIKRRFDNLSKAGYDEIKLSFDDESELLPIKDSLRNEATMFEIIHRSEHSVTLRSVREITPDELDNIYKRILFIILEECDLLDKFIETEDKKHLGSIMDLDDTINRLVHLCLRAMNKQQAVDSFSKYAFIWEIEKFSNYFKFFVKSEGYKLLKDTKEVYHNLISNIIVLINLAIKYDSDNAAKLYNSRKHIFEKALALIGKKSNVCDHSILSLALTMNEMSLSLLGLIFSMG